MIQLLVHPNPEHLWEILVFVTALPILAVAFGFREEVRDFEHRIHSGILRLPTSWVRLWLAMDLSEMWRHAPAAQWRSVRLRLERLRLGRMGRRR
jgi:hypothetical protein